MISNQGDASNLYTLNAAPECVENPFTVAKPSCEAQPINNLLASAKLPNTSEADSNLLLVGFDSVRALVVVLTANGQIIQFNQACEQLTGYSRAEVVGQLLWEKLLPPVAVGEVRAAFANRKTGQPLPDYQAPWATKEGKQRWIEWKHKLVSDRAGTLEYIVATGEELSISQPAEQWQQAQTRMLKMIATGVSLPRILTTLTQTIEQQFAGMLCSLLLVDPQGKRLLLGAAPNLPEGYNQALDGIKIEQQVCACTLAARQRRPVFVSNIVNNPLQEGGCTLALNYGLRACWSVPILASNGNLLGTLTLYAHQACSPHACQRQLLETAAHLANIVISISQLKQLATTDPLTEIPNRRYLMVLAEQEFKRVRRQAGWFSILAIDIDHFKAINDSYGHAFGDEALRQVAKTIATALRPEDYLGRYGGEEFVAVLPQADPPKAIAAAECIRCAISEMQLTDCGKLVSVTVSIGVATYKRQDQALTTVLQRADAALYQAKRCGRNQVVVAKD